ncbi:hypothetical protein LCGC14_1035700 [marine sediment metagenome]|uniref:Uncharacterized protein n=1 Tax=marine sediment metagenome TaxID=412755 RepID=A0A0F9MTA7_9ZZZZ
MYARLLDLTYYFFDVVREYYTNFANHMRILATYWWPKLVDLLEWTWGIWRDIIDNLYSRIREVLNDWYWTLIDLLREQYQKIRTYTTAWYNLAIILFNFFWAYISTLVNDWWISLGDFLFNHYRNFIAFLQDSLPGLRWYLDPNNREQLMAWINNPDTWILHKIQDLFFLWLGGLLTRFAYPHDPEEWE